MSDKEREVKVTDEREMGAEEVDEEVPHDYLEDLKRVTAEFENFRKRTLKEQTAIVERATAHLIQRLLPVLDDFDRALAHNEDPGGIELVRKHLVEVLSSEGLEQIPAEGVPFDPTVHEAVDSVEEDVDEPTCKSLFRPGYRLKDRVLRPAMVVVARPREEDSDDEAAEA